MEPNDPQLIWIALAGIAAICVVIIALVSAALKHGRMQAKVDESERIVCTLKSEIKAIDLRISACKENLYENLVSKVECYGIQEQKKIHDRQNNKDHETLMKMFESIMEEMTLMRKCMQTLAAGGKKCD